MKLDVVQEIKPETHFDVKAKVDSKKWFYTETVKDHFFNPRNLLKNDEHAAEYEKECDGIGQVGSPACISDDTLIHVNFDLHKMKDLSKEHKVLSHDGTYNEITKFLKPKYDGEIIKIKNQFGWVTLTPDHLIYAKQIPKMMKYWHNRNKRKIPTSWVHAGDIYKGDICLYPIPKEIRSVEYIEIPQKRKKWDFNSKKLPDKIKITPELLRFFGYYVAEGCTRENGQEIALSFNIKEKNLIIDVKEIVKKIFGLDVTIRLREENNKTEVVIYNIYLGRYLREIFGVYSQNKKIPEFIMYLTPELQESFLYSVWHGDGYIDFKEKKPRAEYSTTSWMLTQELKILLLRQKITFSIYKEKEKMDKNGVKHKECYRIHIDDYEGLKKMAKILHIEFEYPDKSRKAIHSWFDEDYLYMPIRKVETDNFSGRLANLEVSDTHSYVSNAFTLHNCGDSMKFWLKIDKENDRIKEAKWQTFGCGSAVSSTSMLSVMLTENNGMKINDALKLKPQDIVKRLGDLPQRKFHCSVLGDKALGEALNDYFRKSGQHDRVKVEGAKVIDMVLKITDKDIEEAVLEGAHDFEAVQKKTKVGVHDKSCIPEVEQLIRFYKEKYFG